MGESHGAPAAGLRVIDRETVRRLLPYSVCTPLMREAMMALSAGHTRQVLRQIIDLGEGRAFGVMPGAMDETVGAKLITVFPGNAARGVQSHQGLITLFDPRSGAPVAVIHAGEVTGIRTAAASAAATQVLARPDARRLAVLGAGEQAHAHAEAIAQARPLDEIRLWGRDPAKAGALAARLRGDLGLPVRAAATAREAVDGADIICATTAAREPVLLGDWVADGAHVNLVGSSRAGPREADDALVVRGRVFADHREGVLRQGAEFLHAKAAGLVGDDHVLGEIGEVMAGTLPGRRSPAEVTIYKSLGSIVQDLASGWLIYNRALETDAGTLAPF
jgi:ornithine cyclodeaminase/alanine dehydrogenase-like protein (mu-crystallin family)